MYGIKLFLWRHVSFLICIHICCRWWNLFWLSYMTCYTIIIEMMSWWFETSFYKFTWNSSKHVINLLELNIIDLRGCSAMARQILEHPLHTYNLLNLNDIWFHGPKTTTCCLATEDCIKIPVLNLVSDFIFKKHNFVLWHTLWFCFLQVLILIELEDFKTFEDSSDLAQNIYTCLAVNNLFKSSSGGLSQLQKCLTSHRPTDIL